MYFITVITTHTSVKTTVIPSLKCHFRKLVLLRMIECIDKKEVYSVKLLDAVRFVHKAWECVTEIECSAATKEDDDLPLSEWVRRIDSVNFALCNLDGCSSALVWSKKYVCDPHFNSLPRQIVAL